MYNRCTGTYKFGNNAYPRRIRRRSNLGLFFGNKNASYGPGNTVPGICLMSLFMYFLFFFPHGATGPSGPGPPHYRGVTITHSVGLIWTSDQLVAETST